MIIDVDKLRDDMEDYYGTAMMNGFPMAVVELSEVESASDRDLVQKAVKEGFDLRDYEAE